jgi:hypothetical protein
VFAILFSVGYAYFLTAQQDYKTLQNNASLANQEILVVTGGVYKGNITLQIRDSGPITVTIQSIVIANETSGKTVILGNNPCVPSLTYCNQLPLALNSQVTSNNITTPVVAGSTLFLAEVITSRGTVATATVSNQPAPASQLALQALTSGALGDIYLNFNTYTFYTVGTSSSIPGCPAAGSGNSGYCIAPVSTAFAINCATYCGSNLAFAVTVTDLNSQQGEIVLDQFSMLYQVVTSQSNAKGTPYPWFIVSNSTNAGVYAIKSQYTPVVLQYNKPTTIVFASSNCITVVSVDNQMNDASAGCNNYGSGDLMSASFGSAGTTATVFMMSHGWEAVAGTSLSSMTLANTNYGQNLPYESTVYT